MPESTLPAPPVCDACGRVIPEDAPGGVCPGCLATALLTEGGTRIEPAPGRPATLDGFEIRRTLGEGGFGTVYAAEQLRPVRRPVAIKILKSGAGRGQALARFEAEHQALALMEHPNIAHLYEAGETDDGRPFFVMELIDGVPITEFCRAQSLDLPARLALFRAVCDAIGHAHRRGIIHRDVKPSNILVTVSDGKPVPKVIDFGIAKATDHLLTERTLVTQQHQLLGTPAYMSPEQAAGNSIGIDIRADLYSLGILLYELITGSPPFDASALRAQPYDEALRTIRTEDPPRPSARLRQAGKPLPPATRDLDAVVMKAIEKDPERRYETAGALVRDLDRYLAGQTVTAQPATAAYRLGRFLRRNRVLVGAGAAVFLSLIAGTVVSLLMFVQARQNAREATENEARGKERFSHADYTQATPFMDDDRPGLAVAHLARAVRTDPGNEMAAIRLLETIATQNWPVPALPPLPVGSMVLTLFYNADGSLLFTAGSSRQIAVWDNATGERVHAIDLEDRCSSLALSADGSRLAALLPNAGRLLIWNAETYEQLASVESPQGGGQLSFSPDGNFLVTAHDNGHTHLWDLQSGALRKCIPQEGSFVRAYFSPDSASLAIRTARKLQLWSFEGEPRFETPIAHDADINGVAFTPDGARIVTWSVDQTVRLWNAASGEEAMPPLWHGASVSGAAISPDGSRLATASADGYVRLWNLRDGSLIGAPRPHDGPVVWITFSPDGTKFASGSRIGRIGDGAVKIWDATSGDLLVSPIYHPRGTREVVFHPDGQRIAIGSRHAEVAVWDIRPRARQPLRIPHRQPTWRAVFHDQDRLVTTLTLDGEARTFDARTGQPLTPQPATSGPAAIRAHAAASGSTLRSGIRQGRFYGQRHWTLPSFDRLVAPSYREGGVQCAAASDDGRLLVTGADDGKLRFWDLATGARLGDPLDAGAPVTAVALSASADLLASGDREGNVHFWEVATGRRRATSAPHTAAVLALSFAPGGHLLASGSADHTARLFRSFTPGTALAHDDDVTQLSFSPDGTVLATGSRDNTVRLWQASDDQPVAEPLRHIDRASMPGLFALWSPDGAHLVTTGSHDDTARTWDAHSGRLIAKPMLQPSCPLTATLDPTGRILLLGGDYDFQTRTWDPVSGEPLGPFLKHDERILSCTFTSDGRRFAAATLAGSVYLHDFPAFPEPLTPGALAFAEALGGFRFDDRGILQQVPARDWLEARERLLRSTAADPLTRWMQWLARDPDERPPSPSLPKQAPRELPSG